MHPIHRTFVILGLLPLLALAACGGAGAGHAPTSAPPGPAGGHVEVTLTDFMIVPAQLTLHHEAVTFRVVNRGKTPHNLTLRSATGAIVGHTTDLDPGRSATLPLTLPAGTYTSFCSLPGHESLGMRGTVTVDG